LSVEGGFQDGGPGNLGLVIGRVGDIMWDQGGIKWNRC